MHGVVMEEQAADVLAGLPDDKARDEVLELVHRVRERPYAYPHMRRPGVPEIHEAFGHFCWVRYGISDGAVRLSDVGWLSE